jgi:putative nucleotidyltransferase with HDIG domain
LTLALGVLCHDIAKPNTRGVTKEGKTHFRGHENVGAVMTEEILKRLKYSNDVVEVVVSHVKNHMKFFVAKEMKRSTMVRFARLKNFSELVELGKLDALGSNGNLEHLEFVEKFLNENADVISSNRLINGNDLITLGMMPSPKFKVVLDQVETAQLEGRVKTKEDALNLARKLR